jgi:hypothetical protein
VKRAGRGVDPLWRLKVTVEKVSRSPLIEFRKPTVERPIPLAARAPEPVVDDEKKV